MAKAKVVNADAGSYKGFAPISKVEATWINDHSRFPWPVGRCEKEVTRQGQHTLYKGTGPVQVILRVLGRPWPILAGLDRDHFIDKPRAETKVTAKPLEKAKGHRRQEGTE